VTVYQNATGQGEQAVRAAVAAAGGEKIEPEHWIPFEPVTPQNMADYQK
jgi:ribose transport system substrate-binding protein